MSYIGNHPARDADKPMCLSSGLCDIPHVKMASEEYGRAMMNNPIRHFLKLPMAVWLLFMAFGGAALADGPKGGQTHIIDRATYSDRLHGFWLGQSIANWTGLSTEMVKVAPPFFTDEDWGKPVEAAIWGRFVPHTGRMDFFLPSSDKVWGADDDTDIEYIYQHLLENSDSVVLSGSTIRDGWLRHIHDEQNAPLSANNFEPENYLWVSNERARELMMQGMVPPQTSAPENNELSDMIDAQLTTEIFGLFAPGRPDIALRMAHLPVRVSAHGPAANIAEFYIVMHALAAIAPEGMSMKDKTRWLAMQARETLPEGGMVAAMFDFVWTRCQATTNRDDWEQVRDAIYHRYQKNSHDGYVYKQGFDAGINFAAGLVSLYFGEGDIRRTIRIGTLAGWDSDNPTATWGGLLGFLLGRAQVEQAFGRDDLPDAYWIGRTRRNFPDRTPGHYGEDSFPLMAERGIGIIDRVVRQYGGQVKAGQWYIKAR